MRQRMVGDLVPGARDRAASAPETLRRRGRSERTSPGRRASASTSSRSGVSTGYGPSSNVRATSFGDRDRSLGGRSWRKRSTRASRRERDRAVHVHRRVTTAGITGLARAARTDRRRSASAMQTTSDQREPQAAIHFVRRSRSASAARVVAPDDDRHVADRCVARGRRCSTASGVDDVPRAARACARARRPAAVVRMDVDLGRVVAERCRRCRRCRDVSLARATRPRLRAPSPGCRCRCARRPQIATG